MKRRGVMKKLTPKSALPLEDDLRYVSAAELAAIKARLATPLRERVRK